MTDVATRIIANNPVYNGSITTNFGGRGSGVVDRPVINEPPMRISGYLGATSNCNLDTRFDEIRYYSNNT